MNDCLDFETLAALSDLSADDPRRVHVESCPRCRARLIALKEFVASSGSDVPDAEWRAAEAELRRRRVSDGLVSPPARPPAVRRTWTRAVWRPVFAAAASLVVVLAGAWWVMQSRHEPALRALPGDEWIPSVGSRGAAVTIAWRATPGADQYKVVFLGASLEPVATLEVGPALDARVRRESLPGGLAHGQAVMVEVHAFRGPDVIAQSRAVPLTLP
jgi:hypothetical protein